MNQWKQQLKKLLHLQEQQKTENINQTTQTSTNHQYSIQQQSKYNKYQKQEKQNIQKQQYPQVKQQTQEQKPFSFSITSFLTKTKHQLDQKQQLSKINKIETNKLTTQNQLTSNINALYSKTQLKQTSNPKEAQNKSLITVTTQYSSKAETNNLYKFLQDQVNKQPSLSNQQNQQQRGSDSDDDSLGYTENDWDQQTINFQLEDRMLDCLQDQKHANQYRQSIARSSYMRKKQQPNLNKLNRPPSPKQNDLNQLDFDKIVQQTNISNHQSLNQNTLKNGSKKHIEEKKNTQQKRKNRFSKYKKQSEANLVQQTSLYRHLSPSYEEKLNGFCKQKITQLQATGNQTCDDYIARVFKIRTYEQLKPIKSRQDLGQEKKSEQKDSIKDNILNLQEDIRKKLSVSSGESFEVVEQKRNINLQELHKKASFNSNESLSHQQNQLKYKLFKSDENQQQLLTKSDDVTKKIKSDKIINQQASQKYCLFQQRTQQNKQSFQIHNEKISNQINYDLLRSNEVQKEEQQNKYQIKFKQDQSINKTQTQKEETFLNTLQNKKLPIIYSPIQQKQIFIDSPFKKHSTQLSTSQQLNVIKIKPSPQVKFQITKSPRAKIQFNYVNPQQNQSINQVIYQQSKQQNLQLKKINLYNDSRTKFIRQNQKKTSGVYKLQPQSEERIPIFLQRLRRLISSCPNYLSKDADLQKIRNDLKVILNTMASAISVIELLFKKIKIQRNRLHEPFLKIKRCIQLTNVQSIQKVQLENEIWDFFINSGWETYKIEEIDFIKPKQNFKNRSLNQIKVQEALKMYSEFITFYLNQPVFMTKTSEETQRYMRIRQKISEIVQYLRMISEDLYTHWLIQCHYPYLYYEFLNFLKQTQINSQSNIQKDEIFAKLIEAQQHNDLFSLSIIGKKIIQKIQNPF